MLYHQAWLYLLDDTDTRTTTHQTIDSRERGMLSMCDTQNKSEVARIRQLIALEYESVEQGIKGLAVTSRHDFIARRQQNIQCYVQDLAAIVGEHEVTRMAFESCLGIE